MLTSEIVAVPREVTKMWRIRIKVRNWLRKKFRLEIMGAKIAMAYLEEFPWPIGRRTHKGSPVRDSKRAGPFLFHDRGVPDFQATSKREPKEV